MNIEIRELTPADAPACDATIASLPYWFGDPMGVEDCARAVRTQRGLVAIVAGEFAGFLTILAHDPASVEITWMAVHADHRRTGVGQRLISALDTMLARDGVNMICVLTLGPSVPEPENGDNYEGTRAFYRRAGFVPLRELGLRDWNDAFALMLARPVRAPNALIPELYCSDFDRSRTFYTDVLGFTVVYARPNDRFAFLEREGAQLMIEQPTDPSRTWIASELAHPYGRGINLQIEVSDIAAVHQTVAAAGAPIFVPLEDRWYETGDGKRGNRQFLVQDPDGYLLRFFQDLGTTA